MLLFNPSNALGSLPDKRVQSWTQGMVRRDAACQHAAVNMRLSIGKDSQAVRYRIEILAMKERFVKSKAVTPT
jgi:hypothetical protein